MAGINRYEGKDKRRERRRNHVARDLHSPKYHQRIVPGKRYEVKDTEYDDEEQ